MKKAFLAAVAAATLGFAATSSQAAVFNFTFTGTGKGSNSFSIIGQLTAADSGLGYYDISAVTGSIASVYNGVQSTTYIKSLKGVNSYHSNDNKLFVDANGGAGPYLDGNGFAFGISQTQNGSAIDTADIFYSATGITYDGVDSGQRLTAAGAFTLAAVPEPASWAMMVGGFGLLGGAMRRKRATAAAFG